MRASKFTGVFARTLAHRRAFSLGLASLRLQSAYSLHESRMSWIGIVLALIGIYLAIKVAGFVIKLILWIVVLGGLYWFAAGTLGLPMYF